MQAPKISLMSTSDEEGTRKKERAERPASRKESAEAEQALMSSKTTGGSVPFAGMSWQSKMKMR